MGAETRESPSDAALREGGNGSRKASSEKLLLAKAHTHTHTLKSNSSNFSFGRDRKQVTNTNVIDITPYLLLAHSKVTQFFLRVSLFLAKYIPVTYRGEVKN